MRTVRMIAVMIGTAALALILMVGTAAGMQPPATAAQDRFGCVDGQDAAVAGHPGAAGLVDAAPLVAGLTDDSLPTAWNAVEHADPIDFGGC